MVFDYSRKNLRKSAKRPRDEMQIARAEEGADAQEGACGSIHLLVRLVGIVTAVPVRQREQTTYEL
jgi:hypothetical protein